MSELSLKTRGTPKQARGQNTVEAILDATANLLEDVGFERISTNAICKEAGIAPPSLYRFFPNKYAIVKEMADRLMQAQNAALIEPKTKARTTELRIEEILREQFDVTQAFKGGAMVMRSLYAVPILRDVRLNSHDWAAGQLVKSIAPHLSKRKSAELQQKARLIIELGYASLEHAFDVPPRKRTTVFKETARMLTLYLEEILDGLEEAPQVND